MKIIKIINRIFIITIMLVLITSCKLFCSRHKDLDDDNICDKCDSLLSEVYKKKEQIINTSKNYTFFPTERSDLHASELRESYINYKTGTYEEYLLETEYEIYNYISEEDSIKYELDIFEVRYPSSSYYLIKYKNEIYETVSSDYSHINNHGISHVAITDINNDGFIEILISIITFAYRENDSYFHHSNVTIIDTKSKSSEYLSIFDHEVNYFKENEEGIISIYKTDNIKLNNEDIKDSRLDTKYYEQANVLYEIPTLNISEYHFKDGYLKASCDLYQVEVTINVHENKSPYLFNYFFRTEIFTIDVKMTYLGEPFTYTSPDIYLDGAMVSFVNNNDKIVYKLGGSMSAVTEFEIYTGKVFENKYVFKENIDDINEVGIYDMVITYENEETNIKESIIIEDFLIVSR